VPTQPVIGILAGRAVDPRPIIERVCTMADFQVEFDSDKESTKGKLTDLIGDIGALTWAGDAGTFEGRGMAGGVKGSVDVADRDGGGTDVAFSYSLPFKLKMLGGKIDGIIRSSLQKSGGTIRG